MPAPVLPLVGSISTRSLVARPRSLDECRQALRYCRLALKTEKQIEQIKRVRAESTFLVTIGACATEGGIQALRNWQVVDDFFLRSGYRSRFSDLRDRSEEPGIAGMTFGVGFRKVRSYAIDYAYASLADLGGTHRITLTWDFH